MDSLIVDRTVDTRLIDKTSKNKFKWAWMEETDSLGDYYSDYIRKLKLSGIARCIWCHDDVKYGSAGRLLVAACIWPHE